MIARCAAVLCAAVAAAVWAQGDDVVNERPPADRAAVERHWGLDCAGALSRLGELLAGRNPSPSDSRLDAVRGDIATCALLDRREPDSDSRFRPILDSLDSWRGAADEAARAAALSRLKCLLQPGF